MRFIARDHSRAFRLRRSRPTCYYLPNSLMELHPLVVLVIAIAVVFLLIIRLKINAFLALVTAATTVGVLSSQVTSIWGRPETV